MDPKTFLPSKIWSSPLPLVSVVGIFPPTAFRFTRRHHLFQNILCNGVGRKNYQVFQRHLSIHLGENPPVVQYTPPPREIERDKKNHKAGLGWMLLSFLFCVFFFLVATCYLKSMKETCYGNGFGIYFCWFLLTSHFTEAEG